MIRPFALQSLVDFAHLGSLFFLLLIGQLPTAACAQIASPLNAGQNSGNNSFGSSRTSIGTPNFSRNYILPLVSGVTVDPYGSLIGEPSLIESIRDVLLDVSSANPLLLEALSEAAPSSSGSIALTSPPLLLVSTGSLPPSSVGRPSGFIIQDQSIQVMMGVRTIEIPITSASRVAVSIYVDQALKASFTPSSLLLGVQLVTVGAPVQPTIQLTAALQGLAEQPTLNALAAAIEAFNRILNGAQPSQRVELARSPEFIATAKSLRAARNAMGPMP